MTSYGMRDVEIETHLGRSIDSEFWYYMRQGRAYTAAPDMANGGTGDTTSVAFVLPSDAARSATFAELQVAVGTRSWIRLYDTFDSAPTGGTSLAIQNVLLDRANGTPDPGRLTATQDPTFTAASTHTQELLGGGQGASAIGAAMSMPVVTVEPGRTLVLEVEKLTSGPDEVSLVPRWFETDAVYSERNTDPDFEEVVRG